MSDMLNGILVGIPESTANMQLPDPDLRNFYRDEEDRIFWLDQGVGECATDLIKMIIRCNKEDKGKPVEDRKPIKIFFFSPAGDLDVNYALIDTIRMSKTPVYGINVGRCCSASV